MLSRVSAPNTWQAVGDFGGPVMKRWRPKAWPSWPGSRCDRSWARFGPALNGQGPGQPRREVASDAPGRLQPAESIQRVIEDGVHVLVLGQSALLQVLD